MIIIDFSDSKIDLEDSKESLPTMESSMLLNLPKPVNNLPCTSTSVVSLKVSCLIAFNLVEYLSIEYFVN